MPVSKTMPIAMHRGNLNIMGLDVPCYVLNNNVRVIGRTSATEVLTGIKGGGALEKYIAVRGLEPFIPLDSVLERMVPFRLLEVEGLERAVKGLPADLFVDICQGFVTAMEHHYRQDSTYPRLTMRQQQMAVAASLFLSACAKVGLEALIDEATGYQYEREADALSVKLAAFLEQDMRKWEKTFPDELWVEFGRLSNWKGQVTKRPKYWGKLVMELIYEKERGRSGDGIVKAAMGHFEMLRKEHYETRVLKATVTGDGKVAIITFKPDGHPGVSVQMPRVSLEDFLRQASEALAAAPPSGRA